MLKYRHQIRQPARQAEGYLPAFPQSLKHRWRLKRKKKQEVKSRVSVSHIETSLPPYHSPGASISNYTQSEREVETDLDSFNGNVVLRTHKWNAKRHGKKSIHVNRPLFFGFSFCPYCFVKRRSKRIKYIVYSSLSLNSFYRPEQGQMHSLATFKEKVVLSTKNHT